MQTTKTSAVLAAGLAMLMAGSAAAGDITIKSEKLEISGDLRLRHQTTEETGMTNRDRQRFRLRLGMNYTVNSLLAVKTRFASGSSEQTSTNQTFDNMASQKYFWIDQAYLELKPMEMLKVYGGRMQNPLWQTYSSDIVWDTDLNPEGLAQSVKTSLFGSGRLFFNAQQWVVNERKSISATASTELETGSPQYVFSEQLGIIVPTVMDSRFTLAGGLHDWVNETDRAMITQESTSGPDAGGKFESTNSTGSIANTLGNDFRVMEIGGEFYTSVMNMPLSIQGTFIKNLAHRDTSDIKNPIKDANKQVVTSKQDTGYQVGLQLGKASDPKQWEIAYFRKYVEADATVASAADSDFPGTNREGNIFWVAYAPWANQQFKVKLFQTSIIEGKEKDIDTLQLDWQVKF